MSAVIQSAAATVAVTSRGVASQLAVGVESPALIMVGSVVTLADQLAWFGTSPTSMQASA